MAPDCECVEQERSRPREVQGRICVVGGTETYQGVSGQLTVLRTLKNGDDIDLLRLVRPASP